MAKCSCRKRKIFSRCRKNLWNTFSNYSEESSIHSMSYIGKRNLHWVERIFWIIAFLFSFTVCSYLIYATYCKWEEDPMLVTFKESPTPTWQIPFPAVTICPESKTDIDKFNMTEIKTKVALGKEMSQKESEVYGAFRAICDIFEIDYNPEFNSTKINYIEALRSVSSDYANRSAIGLAWSIMKPFDVAFPEVITDEGVCRSFNMLNGKDLYKDIMNPQLRLPDDGKRSNWTSFGYDENASIFTHPLRILGSGLKAGLRIYLEMRKNDIDYACKQGGDGFRITLHSPDTMPQPSSSFFRVPFNAETLISVTPKVMTTADNMKNYKPEKRQCFFPREKRLKFFKIYNQENCKLECFAEYVLKRCGCVKFSMPHAEGTPICENTDCFEAANIKWTLSELGTKIIEKQGQSANETFKEITEEMGLWEDVLSDQAITKITKEMDFLENVLSDQAITKITKEMDFLENDLSDRAINETFKTKDPSAFYEYEFVQYTFPRTSSKDDIHYKSCKCMPACTSISYDAEVSQTIHDITKTFHADKLLSGFSYGDEEVVYTHVSIYFKEDYFIESKRSELYGWLNFLSSCGGFLGLLMGGSLLSLIEIFYHLTLKKIFRTSHERKPEIQTAVEIDDPLRQIVEDLHKDAHFQEDIKRLQELVSAYNQAKDQITRRMAHFTDQL